MKRSLAPLIFAAALLLPAAGRSQSVDANLSLPLARQRAAVLAFESPQDSMLGPAIARAVALSLRDNLPEYGEISVVVPRNAHERFTENPDYVDTIAAQRKYSLLIYGEYYIDGENVQIRCYARLVPHSPVTEQSFGLTLRLDEGIMKASPPTLQMNFPLLSVPRSLAGQWNAAATAATTLSQQPLPGAPQAGAIKPTESVTFAERRENWIRVKAEPGLEGWLNLPPAPQGQAFPAPDLFGFARLAARFMEANFPDAEKEAADLLGKEKDRQNSMNLAFLRILYGNSMLRQAPAGEPLARYDAIESEYKEAQRLVPGNASPVDHLAILRMLRYAPDSMKSAPAMIVPLAQTEAELIGILQEEKNPQTSDNLKTLYRRAERQRFLKQEGVADNTYNDEVKNRLTMVNTVDKQERDRAEGRPVDVVIVMQEYEEIRLNMNSLRAGAWIPKENAQDFSFNKISYSDVRAKVQQSNIYGAEIEHRRNLSTFMYLHFTFSGWYTGYDFTRPASSDQDTLVTQASSYVLMFPIHIGLSLNLLPEFPISPFVSAAVGGTIAVSGLDYTENGKNPNTADTKLKVAFTWNFGAGCDFFVARNFAFSLAAKYQYLRFNEAMYTGQQDLSGVQLLFGITWKP